MEETKPVCSIEEGCLFQKLGVIPVPVPVATVFPTNLALLRWVVGSILGVFFVIAAVSIFLMVYPFKTVEFTQPIEVTNPQKRVPLLGLVNMHIHFIKHIDNPGLVIRTLVRKRGKEIWVLDSSTVISTRKAGEGVTEAVFPLAANKYLVGTDTYIVFSIYYTLFGIRPMMVQYETEPFEVYAP